MTTSVPIVRPSSTAEPPSPPLPLLPYRTGERPSELFSGLRVAVVHDWLTGLRGGEKVLEAILELFPQAEIFTLFHFPGTAGPRIEQHPIHLSSLQPWAARVGDYRRLLPLLPAAVERWDFRRFDLLVSSSHCVAKGAIAAEGVPHVCYCHTPMRYIWDRFDDYFPPGRPLQRFAMSVLAPRLRRWDRATSPRVGRFVANSEFVRQRIGRYYGREADVVHPFVDRAFFDRPLRAEREGFDLVVSALVPYKRVDLAIDAARRSGRRLRIIGGGPLLRSLQATAPPNVELLGHVSSEVLVDLMERAACLIIPGVEDFGITALEAMAAGTPVVAAGEGGVLDSVIEGTTGLLFTPSNAAHLAAISASVETMGWNREAVRLHAATFSRERFQDAFAAILQEELARK